MFENIEKHDIKSRRMNKDELIQAYIGNRLGKDKKAEFEALFENDQDFRKEVQFHKDLSAAFSDIERRRMKRKLREFENDLKTPKQNNYAPWLVAASILVIIGIGWMTFFNNPTNTDQLYMAYFEPYENVVGPITRGQSVQAMKTEGFVAYEKGEYEDAAQLFQELYANTGESYYLLYEANALMASDQMKKAVPLLEKHLAINDAFAGKSRWYLALAYLTTDETYQAKILLQKIVKYDGYKAEEAMEILDKLE